VTLAVACGLGASSRRRGLMGARGCLPCVGFQQRLGLPQLARLPVVGSSASSPLRWVLSCHSRLAAAGSRDSALDWAGVHFSK
jgi:hypothetical protein